MVSVADIVVFITLMVEGIIDIRTRKCNVVLLGIVTVFGLVYNLIFIHKTVLWIFFGACVGLIMLGISYITREQIGYGDGHAFIAVGVCVGGKESILLLWFSLVLAGVLGIILSFIKKRRLDTKLKLPFIPFAALGYFLLGIMRCTGVILL